MSDDDLIQSALPRYGRIPRQLLRDPNVPDRAKVLYGLLDDYAGAETMPFPSRRTIASALGCSTDTVDRAVAHLVDAGWLARRRRFRDSGGQTSNVYVLQAVPNPEVVGAADLRLPRTDAAPPAAQVRPQEGEPLEGTTTPQAPQRGVTDDELAHRERIGQSYADEIQASEPALIGVADVGGVVQTGNMNSPATASSRRKRPEVTDDDPHWAAFWAAYPNKKSKGAARKAWVRALPKVDGDAGVLIRGAEKQARILADRKRENRLEDRGVDLTQFVKHPATWLNQECWLDQQPVGKNTGTRGTGMPKKGSPEECPDHPGEWADNCRIHASERIAKQDE